MSNKYFLLLGITTLFINVSVSQTLKTFTDKQDGNTKTYTYYIDETTGKEIKHGTYKYYGKKDYQDRGMTSFSVTENYDHGKKNGKQTYTDSETDVICTDGSYATGTVTIIKSFNDDVPDGEWSYNAKRKYRKREYSFAGWSWGNYYTDEGDYDTKEITLHFCNGVLCGKIYSNMRPPYYNREIKTGQLDNNGNCIGKWTYGNSEEEYVNGFLKSRREQGEGYTFSIANDAELWKMIDTIRTLKKDEIDNYCKKNHLKYYCYTGIGDKWLPKDDFPLLDADDPNNKNSALSYSIFVHFGRYYKVEQIKKSPLDEIESYQKAFCNSKFEELLRLLSIALSGNDDYYLLSDYDVTRLKKEIKKIEEIINAKKEIYDNQLEIDKVYELGKNSGEYEIWPREFLNSYREKMEQQVNNMENIYQKQENNAISSQLHRLGSEIENIANEINSLFVYAHSNETEIDADAFKGKKDTMVNKIDTIMRLNKELLEQQKLTMEQLKAVLVIKEKIRNLYVDFSKTYRTLSLQDKNKEAIDGKEYFYVTYEKIVTNLLQNITPETDAKSIQEISDRLKHLGEMMITFKNSDMSKLLRKTYDESKTLDEKELLITNIEIHKLYDTIDNKIATIQTLFQTKEDQKYLYDPYLEIVTNSINRLTPNLDSIKAIEKKVKILSDRMLFFEKATIPESFKDLIVQTNALNVKEIMMTNRNVYKMYEHFEEIKTYEKEIKKYLYNAYIDITTNILEQLTYNYDEQSISNLSLRVELLSNKVLNLKLLSNIDDLRKELKNAKTLSEQEAVILKYEVK